MSSPNSLVLSLHGAVTDRPDARRTAEANLGFQAREVALNLAAREEHPGAVFDVYYDRLVADPVGTVRGIYERFGLDWSGAFG